MDCNTNIILQANAPMYWFRSTATTKRVNEWRYGTALWDHSKPFWGCCVWDWVRIVVEVHNGIVLGKLSFLSLAITRLRKKLGNRPIVHAIRKSTYQVSIASWKWPIIKYFLSVKARGVLIDKKWKAAKSQTIKVGRWLSHENGESKHFDFLRHVSL